MYVSSIKHTKILSLYLAGGLVGGRKEKKKKLIYSLLEIKVAGFVILLRMSMMVN